MQTYLGGGTGTKTVYFVLDLKGFGGSLKPNNKYL